MEVRASRWPPEMPSREGTLADERGVQMRRLDLFSGVLDSKGRSSRIMKMARRLKRPASDDPDDLVSGELLPKSKSAPYFLQFHIDRVRPPTKKGSKEDPALLCHLALALQPNTKVPRTLLARRDDGLTCEWFLDEFRDLLDDDKPLVAADAHFTMAERRQRFLYAPPIEVGAQVLQHCGAEYRGVARTEVGLQRLRWSDRGAKDEPPLGGVDVWMSYAFHWEGVRDLWEQEKGRCATYAQQAL